MGQAIRRYLLWGSALLGLIVSIGALEEADQQQLRLALGVLDWRLGVVVMVALAETLCRVFRLQLVATAIATGVPFGQALRATLAGDLGAVLSPGRVAGEPSRWYVLTRLGMTKGQASAILTGEFATDLLVALALVPSILLFNLSVQSPVSQGILSGKTILWVGAVPLFIFLALAYVTLNHLESLLSWLARLLNQVPQSIPLIGHRRVSLAAGMVRMGTDWQERLHWLIHHGKGFWARAWVMAMSHGIIRFALLPVAAWALHLSVNLAPLLLWECVVYYGLAFVPLPGGGGTTEAASLVYLNRYLPYPETALLLAVWRLLGYYFYLALGTLGCIGLLNHSRLPLPFPSSPVSPEEYP